MEEMESKDAKNILQNLKDNSDMALVEEGLKDNKYEFEHKGVKYRVVKPSGKEKQIIYDKCSEKFVELLSNSKYLMEEELKKVLKIKGIDIDAINKQMNILEQKRNGLLLNLGQMVKENASEQDKDVLKNEILEVFEEQQLLSIKRTKYLNYSIEGQVSIYSYTYLTFLISERLEGEKWVKAFNTFEDMTDFTDEVLINNFTVRAVMMGREEIEPVK